MGVLRHVSGLITALGFAVLIHTTYAVIRHRELLKLMQEEFKSFPPALMLELTLGLVLASVGAFAMSGSLKPVVISKMGGTTDVGSMRMDFLSFHTRARAFRFELPNSK